MQFKKRAPRAIKEVRKFAVQAMVRFPPFNRIVYGILMVSRERMTCGLIRN